MKTTHAGAPVHALISVSEKTGIETFAKTLSSAGFSLLSTGGSARKLRECGLEVQDVAEHTGFPEIMEGRVKTLHPKIHGGILGRRGQDESVMAEHGIEAIDLLVVNLYPFEKVTSNLSCSWEEAVENIDIGGPAMIRAAAKNHRHVCVVVDPSDYFAVGEAIHEYGEVPEAMRRKLAIKAFAHTARYDGHIAEYLDTHNDEAGKKFADYHTAQFTKLMELRYGENPHQAAAFYQSGDSVPGSVTTAEQIQGKELSYNNIADADAALECVGRFPDSPACVIVKHANPCGAACASNQADAYALAYATDPVSSFGGVIALNRELDSETAAAILGQQFVEVIIAPGVSAGAAQVCSAKPNIRVLSIGSEGSPDLAATEYKRVAGGLLVQEADLVMVGPEDCRVVSNRAPDAEEWASLLFALKIAKSVKSNAIVYAKGERSLGIGAGQMSRVDSARIARWKAEEAGLDLAGAAMASEAFFPFRDSIDKAAEAGIRSVIQPGGSMRDEEVIQAANDHGMAMVLTGVRHFKHS